MSIVKATKHSSKSAGKTLDYALDKEKTTDKEKNIQYVEGFGGCSPATAKEEFALNKEHWGKTQGRQAMHYVNSFKGQEVTPQQALDETRELIEKSPNFQGFQGTLSCHLDKENIHVHIVVDSVNVEDGHKFQMGPDTYRDFKELNQQICMEHGYSIVPLEKSPENVRADDINKYKVMEKGESSIEQCFGSVQQASQSAQNKNDFINLMAEQGWAVHWKDNKKYITFESLTEFKADGKPLKFRDKNLSKTFQEDVGKESLSHAFEKNRVRTATIESADRATDREDKRVDTKAIDQAIGNRQLGAIGVEAERREREIAKIKQERERAEREKQRLAEKAKSERARAKETIHHSHGMSR